MQRTKVKIIKNKVLKPSPKVKIIKNKVLIKKSKRINNQNLSTPNHD